MKKVSLIWNITHACPWNCSFCCINAYYLPSSIKQLKIELNKIKRRGIELSLEDKLKIVNNLDIPNIELDVSGGEPLFFKENVDIIAKLSKKFGRVNISITTTSKGLNLVNLNILKRIVREVGFTYDFPYKPDKLRPKGYNSSNLYSIKKVVKKGIKTMAQIPLTKLNTNKKTITKIYENLAKVGVNRLLLMKFFPVGRGTNKTYLGLKDKEYKKAIESYKLLEQPNGPKIYIQTALKKDSINKNSNSLNITSKGLLLSDPWAYDSYGKPIKKAILGDLKYKKLSDIIKFKYRKKFELQ